MTNGTTSSFAFATPTSDAFPGRTDASAVSPFLRTLQLIAANGAEERRRRSSLFKAAPTLVRFAVLNAIRCR